jgi:ubiquinone/menaquinone biosynthesis C-methylase UbiE
MKINYQETTNDLLTRIDIHNKFGAHDIDQWMLETLKLTKGMNILDLACGAGKQCFSFYNYLNGDCQITGGDVSKDLLDKAKTQNASRNTKINFQELNFNFPFVFEDNKFDLISCCFAIYYLENVEFSIKEMHRVLKPGGRLFTTGPMPDNKKLFYDIIREATDKTIPPMPGSSRYGSEILGEIRKQFPTVKIEIFNNPLTFLSVEPFMDYTRASISEDRKLWNTFFDDKDDFEKIMGRIKETASRKLDREGKLVMTKVVGGFIATK